MSSRNTCVNNSKMIIKCVIPCKTDLLGRHWKGKYEVLGLKLGV